MVQRTEDLVRENASLQKELKQFCKKSALDREAAQAKELEAAQLKSNVDKLHKALAQRCNFEGKNLQLLRT